MDSVLVVSSSEKSIEYFTELLTSASINQIVGLKTCGEARRLILERVFDLVIVNAPLTDETGESLSLHIASRGEAQVILVVKNEFFDAVSAVCENDGVLTVAKPLNRTIFWSALTLAKSAQSRIKRMQAENERLKQRIEDIRVIDRAKLVLVSYMGMDEKEAHRYIEKQAMDLRATRRTVAEGILNSG